MGQEKHSSKGGVGGFLQLFDWNGKSRKKLTYNKLDFPGIFSSPIIINRCSLVCILSSHGLFCFTTTLNFGGMFLQREPSKEREAMRTCR